MITKTILMYCIDAYIVILFYFLYLILVFGSLYFTFWFALICLEGWGWVWQIDFGFEAAGKNNVINLNAVKW
jgi:hypothetical protein